MKHVLSLFIGCVIPFSASAQGEPSAFPMITVVLMVVCSIFLSYMALRRAIFNFRKKTAYGKLFGNFFLFGFFFSFYLPIPIYQGEFGTNQVLNVLSIVLLALMMVFIILAIYSVSFPEAGKRNELPEADTEEY